MIVWLLEMCSRREGADIEQIAVLISAQLPTITTLPRRTREGFSDGHYQLGARGGSWEEPGIDK